MSGGDERTLPPSRPLEGGTLPPSRPLEGAGGPAPSLDPGETVTRAPLGESPSLGPSTAGGGAPAGLTRNAGVGALREGTQLGPYVLVRELARGGMGAVFVARHQALGREVALKVLLMPAHRAKQQQVQRFSLEAQAAARLRHPHVVPIHDLGAAAGFHYLTLDLVDGESLQRRLDRAGPLPPRVAARALEQAARGLQHAHHSGVLHRDMKPGNVLLGADGRALVTDFGLAKDLHDGEALTITGELLGTPAYMPPEQAGGKGKHVDARADVYSLGATLYAALTGEPPHQATTLMALLAQILTEPVEPPSRLRAEVPAALDAICLRALAKDPAARYPTAGALADDLARFLAGEAPLALGAAERARRPRELAMAAGALAVFAVAAAVALLTSEEPAPGPGEHESAAASPALETVWGWERRDVPGPPPRRRAQETAVWDAARREVVLFGGLDGDRLCGQTWTWDGAQWRAREVTDGPAPRYSHAMAYDAARERVLLLGGSTGRASEPPVLWEWDGAAWSKRPLEGGPGVLAHHAMAYDPSRRVLWVVGGTAEGRTQPEVLWSLDPVSGAWTRHDASPAPKGRRLPAVTFDPIRGRLIVFGGDDPDRCLDDVWEWDGARWHAFPDAAGPSPRRGAVMLFDGERALLLGGDDSDGAVLDDLWAWDGARWRELTPERGPPARSRAAWVWLPTRREGLLLGGDGLPARRGAETWIWRASEVPRAPAEAPAEPLGPPPARRWREPWPGVNVPHPREGHENALVYDPLRREVVLFGGWDGSAGAFGDLWTWRGAEDGWRRVPEEGEWPAPRIGHGLAFDEARGRLVLYGGVPRIDQPQTDDLWEWDGARWEQRRPSGPGPGPRAWHGFTYDPARGEVVLFGGDDGARVHGDLWSWDGERWERLAEEGPPPRSHPGLVADRRRGRLVLYGGLGLHESLWEWDGERWRRMRPDGPRPPDLQAPRLVFDGERVLLHGGFSRRRGNVADLWSWDGVRWERLEVSEGPSGRVWHGFAWDANRGVGVVFGGSEGRRRLADTWELIPAE